MFSFHKPKVYRSATGCCICRAKSSSSRFTDSRKYESDFAQCFQLNSPRQGEICNACVLLVKRFKRLPTESGRHWGHVVDARAGPGIKSMTKAKKRCEGPPPAKNPRLDPTLEGSGEECSSEEENLDDSGNSGTQTREVETLNTTSSQTEVVGAFQHISSGTQTQDSDTSDFDIMGLPILHRLQTIGDTTRTIESIQDSRRRKHCRPQRNFISSVHELSFLSNNCWNRASICCGKIYIGPKNTIFYDLESYNPCVKHLLPTRITADSMNTTVDGGVQVLSGDSMDYTSNNAEENLHNQNITHITEGSSALFDTSKNVNHNRTILRVTEDDSSVTDDDAEANNGCSFEANTDPPLTEVITGAITGAVRRLFNDNSSDSGYDDTQVPPTDLTVNHNSTHNLTRVHFTTHANQSFPIEDN